MPFTIACAGNSEAVPEEPSDEAASPSAARTFVRSRSAVTCRACAPSTVSVPKSRTFVV